MMEELKSFPLVYLGTPYSKYPGGLEIAFQDTAKIAASLLKLGVKVYAPIVHGHPLSVYGGVDPFDHSIWLPFDQAMMDASSAILVAMMDGWRESFGIDHEIKYFKSVLKPVLYLDPETMAVMN